MVKIDRHRGAALRDLYLVFGPFHLLKTLVLKLVCLSCPIYTFEDPEFEDSRIIGSDYFRIFRFIPSAYFYD